MMESKEPHHSQYSIYGRDDGYGGSSEGGTHNDCVDSVSSNGTVVASGSFLSLTRDIREGAGSKASTFTTIPSVSPSLYSSVRDGERSSDDEEDRYASYNVRKENYTRRKRRHEVLDNDQDKKILLQQPYLPNDQRALQSNVFDSSRYASGSCCRRRNVHWNDNCVPSEARRSNHHYKDGKPHILMVDCDVMSHILAFLEPLDVLGVLTMPLSKDWQNNFTRQQELWRALCLSEPFKAKFDGDDSDGDDSDSSSDGSVDSVSTVERQCRKFRRRYTSYVHCMSYLSRIKDDAMRVIEYGKISQQNINANTNDSGSDSSENSELNTNVFAWRGEDEAVGGRQSGNWASARHGRKRKRNSERMTKKKRKLKLPWSCAIHSIVNWMVAFSHVEGIQIMCLKVLRFVLEDERQRITAQQLGLTDVILRGMVMFPDNVVLHTVSFHTIVLLARPIGGKEGMLFHGTMVNSSGILCSRASNRIFNTGSQSEKCGIAIMLDSMRRFVHDGALQAMSCWSFVNIALSPLQKEVLLKLGGIDETINAMTQHPRNAEVQFRALFALINLVIRPVSLSSTIGEQEEEQEGLIVDANSSADEAMLDEVVGRVVDLVVLAMKHFFSDEAILNRACLVLHNLSLKQEYHDTLLLTPNCYQMLEWCLINYPTDQILQQSAAGTIHRLQVTLSKQDDLAARFASMIQSQSQESIEDAHNESVQMYKRQKLLRRYRGTDFGPFGTLSNSISVSPPASNDV